MAAGLPSQSRTEASARNSASGSAIALITTSGLDPGCANPTHSAVVGLRSGLVHMVTCVARRDSMHRCTT